MLKKIVAASALVALSFNAANTASAADEIKVGVLYPTTGGCTSIGTPALMGHQVMVDEINAAGGLLGKKVTFVHRDSKCKADASVAAARDLITKDKVQFLLGGVSSSVGLAVSEVAKQEGVIYIAAIPKTTKMTNKENFHKYVFRSAANTNTEGKSAATIANRQGWDKLCTILLDYSYGHSLDEAFRAQITKVRPQAKIVAQEWVKTGTSDYTPYISKLMSAGCDGVFSNIHIGYFPTFSKQAATFGFFDAMGFVSAGEVGSSNLSEALGDDMPSGIWVNAYDVFYFPDTPENNAYVDGLRKVTGKEHPSSWALPGYMAMQWLAEGIKAAGSADTDAVIAALEGLTIKTPVGSQTMRASDHQANRGQIWGQMNASNIDGYKFKVMNPVEYIPADDIMD